jgi:hypothetical protein
MKWITDEATKEYIQKYGKLCTRSSHMKRVHISEFSKNKQNKDGLHCFCNACRSEIRKEFYKENKK